MLKNLNVELFSPQPDLCVIDLRIYKKFLIIYVSKQSYYYKIYDYYSELCGSKGIGILSVLGGFPS